MALFALVFIVLPLVEIYVAVQVAHVIGALDTVLLLLVLSISGIWLTKLAGFGVIARVRRQLAAGQIPANELIDGAIVLTGGVLLVVPGFVTAIAGLLLLFPPTRVAARGVLKRRFVGKVTYLGGSTRSGRIEGPDDVIDV